MANILVATFKKALPECAAVAHIQLCPEPGAVSTCQYEAENSKKEILTLTD